MVANHAHSGWYLLFCASLTLLSSSSAFPGTSGFKRSLFAGSIPMLVLRLTRHWAGDAENLSVTVFLHVSTAPQTYSPFCLAFCMMFFAVFTDFSAFPFDCGYLGLEVKCRNPHSVGNSEQWSNESWGPLSDLNLSGTPCLAKMDFNFRITAMDVVFAMLSISQKLEK